MEEKVTNVYELINKIDLENLYITEKERDKKKGQEIGSKKINPADCLYDKTYECPVCSNEFKSKAIRKGKARYIHNEIDLKPLFEPIQPDYYDVIICNKCGYSAISSCFTRISDSQAEKITSSITPKFYPKQYPEIYSIDDAIERYKLALLSCIVKNAKAGEKAYVCLKIGWFYRDKKDIKNELKYIKAAFDGFKTAYESETFPICGLDEHTLLYMIAALGVRIGCYKEALRALGQLSTQRNLSTRLKNKIYDLKEYIREKIRKMEKSTSEKK